MKDFIISFIFTTFIFLIIFTIYIIICYYFASKFYKQYQLEQNNHTFKWFLCISILFTPLSLFILLKLNKNKIINKMITYNSIFIQIFTFLILSILLFKFIVWDIWGVCFLYQDILGIPKIELIETIGRFLDKFIFNISKYLPNLLD